MRLALLFLVLAVAVMSGGCAVGRTTTTERTAVEQALLSESAERAMSAVEAQQFPGTTAYVFADEVDSVDEEYLLSALRLRLLHFGLNVVDKPEEAELIVYPRVGIAAIDDNSTLVGIPSIPIIIPGGGTLSTPEIALYKRTKQIGRHKFGLYLKDRESNGLETDLGRFWAQNSYTRWTILLIFTFATTDLPEPYYTFPRKRSAKSGRMESGEAVTENDEETRK